MKIEIRITKRCMISATEVGEIGQTVWLDPIQAAGLLAGGRGVACDEAKAKEAFAAWNASALRIEANGQMRGPPPLSWVAGGRFH